MKPIIHRFSDDLDALMDVARTIDANAEAARAFGKNNDHEGMAELGRAIIDEGRDQNAEFAASELWVIYQRERWQ